MLFSDFQKMNNFSKLALLLGIFFALFMAVSMCYNSSNKKEFFQSCNEDTLYFFNVDWCGHCKAAKPEWEKIEGIKNNKILNRLKLVNVDGDDEKNSKLLEKFGVNAYPAFILQKGGEGIEYQGNRTVDGLLNFVNENYN